MNEDLKVTIRVKLIQGLEIMLKYKQKIGMNNKIFRFLRMMSMKSLNKNKQHFFLRNIQIVWEWIKMYCLNIRTRILLQI
jgi:hypothetical protein